MNCNEKKSVYVLNSSELLTMRHVRYDLFANNGGIKFVDLCFFFFSYRYIQRTVIFEIYTICLLISERFTLQIFSYVNRLFADNRYFFCISSIFFL